MRRLTYSDNLDILRYSPYPAFSDALIPYLPFEEFAWPSLLA